ncbi:Hypothetical protein A7982_06250 [Minicystis rosea]|nr:Hypothetical protein A7982_06250 [Minicystis rosea]
MTSCGFGAHALRALEGEWVGSLILAVLDREWRARWAR